MLIIKCLYYAYRNMNNHFYMPYILNIIQKNLYLKIILNFTQDKLDNANMCIIAGHIYCIYKKYYEATELFFKSLKIDKNPYALNSIAYLYCSGIYFEKNYKKAEEFYIQSIKMNNASAMYSLACMYTFEDNRNYPYAIKYFKKSLKYNNYDAAFTLYKIYKNVMNDKITADKYLKIFLLNEKSEKIIKDILIKINTNNYDINEIFDSLFKASKINNNKANNLIAQLLANKSNFENLDDSIILLKKAVFNNDINSIKLLAYIYINKVNKYEEGIKLLTKAAKCYEIDSIELLIKLFTNNIKKNKTLFYNSFKSIDNKRAKDILEKYFEIYIMKLLNFDFITFAEYDLNILFKN